MVSIEEAKQERRDATEARKVEEGEMTLARCREVIAAFGTDSPLPLNHFSANKVLIAMNRADATGDSGVLSTLHEAMGKQGYKVVRGVHQLTKQPMYLCKRQVGVTTDVIDPSAP